MTDGPTTDPASPPPPVGKTGTDAHFGEAGTDAHLGEAGTDALAGLDERLRAAAELVQADRHADIGSDHAALPLALLRSGRARHAVIVEKTGGPLAVARTAVQQAGLQDRATLHLGDGLAPLGPQDLHSVSLTGMGARTMLGILGRGRAGGRVPGALVLQPNDDPGLLRGWAQEHGYWLVTERLARGFWRYPVLRLERHAGPDPAYADLPADAARRYGPHLLRARDALLQQELSTQLTRLEALARHGRPQVLHDLNVVRAALAVIG
ncbi:tRNA (adenine(22)-N(1))-methyltransferase [Deinococcus aquiradiocola]|uniref:tRNA (Adenine-N(1))-methyltransferase n=1 Tax=Deinococcus aquiradiocola TaxID=393059 RepID=A0A917URI2_9DEIO|nr:tRNA (adenine(22)-N(1))-methyltransferase TrmK [Deinococcus aquiradiocola]GGJ79224.1 tRNA (adenine-N(1))-methyltransferase [Deinococcus aquiradiocola]